MIIDRWFQTSLIGLDISTDAIRLVELNKRKGSYDLCYQSIDYFQHPIMIDGKIKDWDAVSSLLKQRVLSADLKNKKAAICLPAYDVKIDYLELPKDLSDEAILAEIDAIVSRDWSHNSNAYCMDFCKLQSKHQDDVRIVYAIADQTYLSQYIDCIKASGLKVKVVDLDIYALMRSMQYMIKNQHHQNQTHALIYVRKTWMIIIVFNHTEVILHRYDDQKILNDAHIHEVMMTLNQIAFCSDASILTAEEIEKTFGLKVWCPDIFPLLNLLPKAKEVSLTTADILLSVGLAMREVPTWST